MLREGARSESTIRRRVEEFTDAFRPQGVSSAYELLFIPTDDETPFAPPPAQTILCLSAWSDLIAQIHEPGELAEANWVEAAEVTFAYLVCAGRAGFNLADRETLQQIVTRTRRLEVRFSASASPDHHTPLERLSAVADEIVAQGYATQP